MTEKKRLPSLNQIAREIGVSAATISRVLNGRPGIAEKTREQVLGELKKYGYPGKVVRGGFSTLRNSGSTVAFAITRKMRELVEAGDPFYGRHILAIQTACSQTDYYPILVDYEHDRTDTNSLRCVEERRVHGVVAEHIPLEILEQIREKVGVVLLNIVAPMSQVDYVIPDVRQAAREQVQHLYDLGHRNIACFRSLPGGWQNHHYWAEYWWMCQHLQLDLPPEYFKHIEFQMHGEVPAIKDFLQRLLKSRKPPTAIVTGDNYAVPLMKECQRLGLSIPGDVSIFGFDDRNPASSPVSLSTYRQNFNDMARECLRLLADRCQNPQMRSRLVEVEGDLVLRDSVAPPRGASPKPRK